MALFYFWSYNKKMENKDDNTSVLASAIEYALSGNRHEFELITSLDHYRWCRELAKKSRAVGDMFDSLHNSAFCEYLVQTANGEPQDLELLSAVRQFELCAEFYYGEADTAKDMAKEYRAYLRSGHRLEALFGAIRSEADMVDYRKLPWRLW